MFGANRQNRTVVPDLASRYNDRYTIFAYGMGTES
jgi:hypothetical protein